MPLLHITNGRAVIDPMRAADIAGPILPWDDVLHEGPVPAGLGPAALRDVRADFLAAWDVDGAASRAEIARSLAARDALLEQALATRRVDGAWIEEIVLWFEHDLYDQLQLLQVLDRVPADGVPALTMVPADDYLGTMPPDQLSALLAARRGVTSAMRVAARDAWEAFRSADPRALVDVVTRVSDLPHLPAALHRHLQQLPSMARGLSRTEEQALAILASGPAVVRDLYRRAHHGGEEAIFMGDAAFVFHLSAIAAGEHPLIAVSGARSAGRLSLDATVAITADGRRVLDGAADRVRLCGIDRWLGGVHLTGMQQTWRWDARAHKVRLA